MSKIWVRAGLALAVASAVMGFGISTTKGVAPSTLVASEQTPWGPTKVDNFRLTDQNLLSKELYRMNDASAVVIITVQNGCPICRNTGPAVKALMSSFAGKGVEFMMLNSTPADTREEILAEAKAYGYDLPILLDRNQLVGEQLGVTRTAEVIIIQPKTWKVIYRGPIDDRVTYERQRAKANKTWAADALTALLAGNTTKVAWQNPEGCLIDIAANSKVAAAKVSYAKDVAPIIQAKCVACHQAGGIGPMPLTNYQRIKSFSPMIREVLRTQRMPPWRADPSVGKFHDDKSLSGEQIRTLVHWIEAGAPRGEGDDPIAAIAYQAEEWPLGKPDLILDLPAYDIPASGIVDYQRPFVLNPLPEGKWLRASTVKVDNRQSVHHILTGYLNTPPAPGEQANESQWGASVGGYAVGAESIVQPDDIGVYLPAGGAIGFQNHYTPFGRAVTEKSKIALYFYDKKPSLMMHNSVIANPNISIPPNEENWQQSAYVAFPKDAILYGAFPHAHYRGSSSQLWIQYPDGAKKLLLALPHYDFNWQREFQFAEPINVPAGSKLIAVYTYDNSKRNPANPDPNRTVPWGDQSFDEMLYTALRYRWVGETSDTPNDFDALLNKSRMFGILDSNMDGKLEKSEATGRMGAMIAANFDKIDMEKKGYITPETLNTVMDMVYKSRRSKPAAPAATGDKTTAAPVAATPAAPKG
jgi:peroxiredoxin